MKKKIGLAVASLVLGVCSFGVSHLPSASAMIASEASATADINSMMEEIYGVLEKGKHSDSYKDENAQTSLIIFKPDIFMDVKRFAGADGSVKYGMFSQWSSSNDLWREDCKDKVAKFVERLNENGLVIEKISDFVQLSEDVVKKHYAAHKNKGFFKDLVQYMTSGPVIVATVKGENAIAKIRFIAEGEKAKQKIIDENVLAQLDSMPKYDNSFREEVTAGYGDLARQCNGLHASDSVESAKAEIGNLGRFLTR